MATLPQFPTFDFSDLDAVKMADKATAIVRDGLYITVGIGVLGAQRAAELLKQSAVKLQDALEQAKVNADKATARVKTATEKATTQAKHNAEKATKPVRGIVGKAA